MFLGPTRPPALSPHAHSEHALRRALISLVLAPLAVTVVGCDIPSPQSAAEPIGEYPEWGQNFGKETSQPAASDSLLSGEGPAPSDAPNNAEATGGGGATAPGMKNTFSSDDWGSGDAALGQQVFVNHCARCHGDDGRGAMMPGIGRVPTLTDPAWHQRVSDKDLASTIAHGKGAMPSFMQTLEKRELDGVIAYIRSLAKK